MNKGKIIMNKVMGVGIIGCGNISWAYLKLAQLFKAIEVRAVADVNMSAAEARAKEFGVKAQSVKQLLRNPDIQIVVNLTVPAVHHKVSKQILEAGKHVYTEKPLTLSYKDALSLQKTPFWGARTNWRAKPSTKERSARSFPVHAISWAPAWKCGIPIRISFTIPVVGPCWIWGLTTSPTLLI
jgi:pyrroline-5-carboxylate reductase